VARISPFRAVRYDEGRAGPLARLIAPPYDVIGVEERARYLAESPYNVVHLTLPDDEREAARLWHEWLAEGALVRDEKQALWWLAQDYVGPDGVGRSREGLVGALHVEPYSARVVLPHERTHAGPKEGRLRLLRAIGAHVEPIFLLYDGALQAPRGEPLLEVSLGDVSNRLWRLAGETPPALADAPLVIADGHHRYETALTFHDQEGTDESAWLLAVLVPTRQEGLTIFPTHRIAAEFGEIGDVGGDEIREGPLAALQRASTMTRRRSAVVLYRGGKALVLEGEDGELDAALVERLSPRGVTYTPQADEAIAAVDSGSAEAAFLLRPPTVDQVQDVARRGETMPQKSTYFYPKLPSGLLFLPL
jgi:uncharacterized protein (DUF1015 family)